MRIRIPLQSLNFVFSFCLLAVLVGCGGTSFTQSPYPDTTTSINETIPSAFDSSFFITPIAPEVLVGASFALQSPNTNTLWLKYDNSFIGISLLYPPEWSYYEQPGQRGVFFYPENSDQQLPSDLIAFIFIPERPYTGQPLIETDSIISPITLNERTGIEYQDSKYAVPTESYYLEFPSRNGTLLIKATLGPVINLVPQLHQILMTFVFIDSFVPNEVSTISTEVLLNSSIQFVYPLDRQILGYEGWYLFKVTPVENADGYLWGFFQNNVLIWENLRDEGVLSGTEYGIMKDSFAQSKFEPGDVEVWVRASINGQWTYPAIITILLEP
jgi:hypothetical protein